MVLQSISQLRVVFTSCVPYSQARQHGHTCCGCTRPSWKRSIRVGCRSWRGGGRNRLSSPGGWERKKGKKAAGEQLPSQVNLEPKLPLSPLTASSAYNLQLQSQR